MSFSRATVIAVAALASVASAHANVVVIDQLVDANFVAANGYSEIDWLAPTRDLAIGDELIMNFDFLPGQTLEMFNPGGLWGAIFTGDSEDHLATFTRSMWFRNLHGPAHNVGAQSGDTGGMGLTDAFFPADFMDGTGSGDISFTGVSFDFKINGYSDGVTTRPYNISYMVAYGDSLAVGQAMPVPEPSSVALMLGGLAAVGAGTRRKVAKAR
ncbi:PEP-CTERM sorting domain-containing protein [Piscinibacter terrae]|uniref:PEP-CTERM sorting domain-containing protein n=1 Tax=Piscinibacter terrae TaxID=2496871 RepID=A0A3N7HIN6_9BURK|nr:PEP-CTERM sorting domain-containing protein [Albitalea terrae]RQP21888.1 PEP-CTERM sorting domain-containing protein [Albitalea terrae]